MKTDCADPGPCCQVRVLNTLSQLEAERDSWRRLWNRCYGARTPYLSFEWVHVWARHYSHDRGLHVLVAEADGTALGIMPLAHARYRLGPLSLGVLETVGGESRNLIALVAPGSDSIVARAMAEHFAAAARAERRVMRLALVPSGHPFLRCLVDALGAVTPRLALRLSTCNYAPYVPLPALWDDFQRSLGKRRQKILARAQRKLDLERKQVRLVQRAGADVQDAMGRLYDMHDARWKTSGIRGLFHDPRNRAYHLDLARMCDAMGWLDLSELEIDGVSVSAYFACVLDSVGYMMRSGRDTAFLDYDVGHLHDYGLFRKWIATGLREADLLRGAEPYKFYWTRKYRVYKELTVVRSGISARLSLTVVRFWMRAARFLGYRHPPGELLAYMRTRRANMRELRTMGVRLTE